MKNLVQQGQTLTLVAPYALASGEAFLKGKIFAVATNAAAAAANVEAMVEGVFSLPKAAVEFSQGEAVYWDAAAKKVTDVAAGNTLVGCATEAAAADVGFGVVSIDRSPKTIVGA